MLSHVLPFVLYLAPRLASDLVPRAVRPWLDPAGVAACGVALVVFARRGAYPELRRTDARRGARALAVSAGVAVALLWMPLAVLVPSLGSRGWFLPEAAGAAAAPWLWAARLTGFVLVIPFAEELLVRSLLPRWVDATDAWCERPVGSFTAVSAAVSIAFFAGTHPEWLAALVTGVLWTLLLRSTRRLGDVVLSHALANALLAAAWLHLGDRSWW